MDAKTSRRILEQFIKGERNSVGDQWGRDMALEAYAALTAQLEAVRRDAERYRWLCEGENASVRLLHLPPSGVGWPKTLDEAIDAARQQEATNGR